MPAPKKIAVENVRSPGRTTNLDAEKYHAMRSALLAVLPDAPPGMTHAEMQAAVLPDLPAHLWPGGAKVMWWSKTVQLDLEAKGLLARTDTKPLAWYRTDDGRRDDPAGRAPA